VTGPAGTANGTPPARPGAACTVPENWRRCGCEALDGIRRAHRRIEAAAAVLDRDLCGPEPWRGRTRREMLGYGVGDEPQRYRAAFDWVVTMRGARGEDPLGEELLREIHHRAVGGRRYRTCHLWVSNGFRHAEPDEIPKLLRTAFVNHRERCRDWPSSARALGLHLDIVTAHPFRDGNGRTARLAAALVLVRAGFRSTVFTAIDRHYEREPGVYLRILDGYRYAASCRTRTVQLLVQEMFCAAEARL
jgi:hypothetical protein